MDQWNVWSIQEEIRTHDVISLPWIQWKLELGYRDAKSFMEQLILRGWVEKEPQGIEYRVVKDNLCLRKLQRSEVNALIEDITADCITITGRIHQKNTTGATLDEITAAVRSKDDTDATIKVLTDHRLIYCVDGRYYNRVSQATIKVLTEVVKKKRERMLNSRLSDQAPDNTDLAGLFDELFDPS